MKQRSKGNVLMMNSRSEFGQPGLDEASLSNWGWFVSLGMGLGFLGVLAYANLAVATEITVYYVGTLMILGGVLQIIQVLQVKKWSGFFGFGLSGLFYTLAGILVFLNPQLMAAPLTLLLGLSLIISGAFRAWSGLHLNPQTGWGWLVGSGAMTLLAGILFVAKWPADTLWLLGLVLATDLIFQGFTAVAFGIAIYSSKREAAQLPIETSTAF
jgi:uncharacterized membrane protein HdeD (DUF308 family)